MENILRQVSRARWRLSSQHFLDRLGWSWLGALIIATLAIAAIKIWPIPVDATTWGEAWIGGSLALGAIVAAIWTLSTRADQIETAIEIDRRFGLRERISSSLSLDAATRETSVGQAVLADAARRADRLDVAERFPVRVDRRMLLPLAPGLVVFLLTMFVDNKVTENAAEAKTSAAAAEKQTQAATKALERKLAERRKQIEEKNLPSMEGILRQLEQGANELAKKEGVDRKQALVKLNDLAKDLEKRREKMGGADQLKQQFQSLKNTERGPADTLAQSLKNGDFQRAMKEIDKLKRKLDGKDGKGLDEKAKQELAKQLDQMRQSLKKAADDRQQAKQELERKLEQLRKAGDTAAAEKVQDQLDKLSKQQSQNDRLQEMAKNMANAAEAMKQGDMAGAQKAMDALSEQLGEMQATAEEMELLDDVAKQLADAKAAMACKNCNGEGCGQCQGKGFRPGNRNNPNSRAAQIGGQGAPRDVEENDTKMYDSNVKSNVTKGPAVIAGQADGPNLKGATRESIKQELEMARQEAVDPLANQKLPKGYREKVGKYFDRYRKGREAGSNSGAVDAGAGDDLSGPASN